MLANFFYGINIAIMSKCKEVNDVVYELTRSLSENLKGSLLTIEEIEREMSRGEGVGDE